MNKLNIYKAQNISGVMKVEKAQINFNQEFPKMPTLQDSRELFQKEGEELEDFLGLILPGGTYDALYAAMVKKKASLWVVSHKEKINAKN